MVPDERISLWLRIRWSGTLIWSPAYSILMGTALAQILWLHVLKLVPANTTGMVLVVAALSLPAAPGLSRLPTRSRRTS